MCGDVCGMVGMDVCVEWCVLGMVVGDCGEGCVWEVVYGGGGARDVGGDVWVWGCGEWDVFGVESVCGCVFDWEGWEWLVVGIDGVWWCGESCGGVARVGGARDVRERGVFVWGGVGDGGEGGDGGKW